MNIPAPISYERQSLILGGNLLQTPGNSIFPLTLTGRIHHSPSSSPHLIFARAAGARAPGVALPIMVAIGKIARVKKTPGAKPEAKAAATSGPRDGSKMP